MKFYNYLKEEIDKETIKYWSSYAKNMDFDSEKKAREWILYKLDKNEKEFPFLKKLDNKKIAREIPIYKQGKKFKIGKRIRKAKLSWKDIEIGEAHIHHIVGMTVNPMDIERTIKTKFYPINKIHGTEKVYQDQVNNIVEEIKEENIFYPIVIDDNFAILDGHHRFEAVKKLKLKTIPAVMIVLKEY